jgi:hypothetical protein
LGTLSAASSARALTAACQPVVTLIDVAIADSAADANGGGLHAASSIIEAQRLTVANCSAGVDGGGLSTHGSTLFSPNLVAAHNSAARYGGAAVMQSCVLTGLRLTDSGQVALLAPSASCASGEVSCHSAASAPPAFW